MRTVTAPVTPTGANGSRPRLLDRAAILGADDLPREVVDVPEWGGSVMVRGLTGTERDAWELSVTKDQGGSVENYRAKLVVRCLVDHDGNNLFTGSNADAAALGRKSSAGLQRIFEVAQRLSAVGDREVEELAESFTDAPNAATGSG